MRTETKTLNIYQLDNLTKRIVYAAIEDYLKNFTNKPTIKSIKVTIDVALFSNNDLWRIDIKDVRFLVNNKQIIINFEDETSNYSTPFTIYHYLFSQAHKYEMKPVFKFKFRKFLSKDGIQRDIFYYGLEWVDYTHLEKIKRLVKRLFKR